MLIVVPYHGRVTPDFLFSDTGTGTGKCKPKLPPEIGGSVARAPGIKILWPLIFRLRPQTAMADFGLPSTAPCCVMPLADGPTARGRIKKKKNFFHRHFWGKVKTFL